MPPELVEDAIRQILLRVPADDPALLIRASLACKQWRRLLTDPAFLRSYRAFHRAPPVLGFLRQKQWWSEFVPTSSFRPRDLKRDKDSVLDCRHGRVLLDCSLGDFLVVWDPITGEDQRIPMDNMWGDFFVISDPTTGEDQHIPLDEKFPTSFNAAVMCDITGCDHLDCYGGPFLIVLVASYEVNIYEQFTCTCVYSSVAGQWSAQTAVESPYYIEKLPPVLAGDLLYFPCDYGRVILRYSLRDEEASEFLDVLGLDMCDLRWVLMPAENGGLRCAVLDDQKLDLWSQEITDEDAVWKETGVIQLDTLLSNADAMEPLDLIGFAKVPDEDVVFVSTNAGIFMIWLQSHKVKKVCDKDEYWCTGPIFPYMAFFTPAPAAARSRSR